MDQACLCVATGTCATVVDWHITVNMQTSGEEFPARLLQSDAWQQYNMLACEHLSSRVHNINLERAVGCGVVSWKQSSTPGMQAYGT